MTILILSDPHDATAQRVAARAREACPYQSIRMLSSLDVARSAHWSHRIGTRGVITDVRFANDTTLRSDDIAGVFNRMSPVPAWTFRAFDATDREYAQAEVHSLLVSWLAGLRCPVVNPASPHALCGSPLSIVRWRVAAHRAGLATLPIRFTTSQRRFPATGMVKVNDSSRATDGSTDASPFASTGPGTFVDVLGTRAASVLVVGDRTWSEGLAPDEGEVLGGACLRLARSTGLSLLRVHFVSPAGDRGWLFCGANALPDVQDAAALLAVVDLIAGRAPAVANEHVDDGMDDRHVALAR